MTNTNDKNNAFLLHLTSFCAYLFPFGGIIVPWVVWEIKKEESDYLNRVGKDVVNFNLSYLLYTTILAIIIIALVAFMFVNHFNHLIIFSAICVGLMIAALEIIKFILIILGSISANRGELYKYPGTINFINY